MAHTPNHNPELDHEFNQEKQQPQTGIPLMYRDHDGVNEPYEMYAINRLGGVKTKGWKDILLKILIVVIVFLIGGFLYQVVFPWISDLLGLPSHFSYHVSF